MKLYNLPTYLCIKLFHKVDLYVNVKAKLRYWYECDGGRELINVWKQKVLYGIAIAGAVVVGAAYTIDGIELTLSLYFIGRDFKVIQRTKSLINFLKNTSNIKNMNIEKKQVDDILDSSRLSNVLDDVDNVNLGRVGEGGSKSDLDVNILLI